MGSGDRARWVVGLLSLICSAAAATSRGADVPSTIPAASGGNSAAEATYYTIPIIKQVTIEEGTAERFSKALDAARAAKASHVLLVLDTPGGRVDEMNLMLELMAASATELKFVALVHNAGSAGAVLAMSCPDVVITPSGAMGAAAMVGLPDDARRRMKFESYALAKVRAAVEAAGNDVLIARGMMEPGLRLAEVTSRDGARRIVDPDEVGKQAKARGKKAKLPDGAKIRTLKEKGTLISLTPDEALELGVVRGIVQTSQRPRTSDIDLPLDEVGPLLGFERWREVGSAEAMMRKYRAGLAAQDHKAAHAHELQKIEGELRQLQERAASLQGQINSEQANIENLPNSARPSAMNRINAWQAQLTTINGQINALNKRKRDINAGPPKPKTGF